ncbi:MAG: hypothetical protein V3V08_06675 [Nannocystaceae bacterium]
MAGLIGVALACLAAAVWRRVVGIFGAGLRGAALALLGTMGLAGLVGILLGWAGAFTPIWLVGGWSFAAACVVAWPCRAPRGLVPMGGGGPPSASWVGGGLLVLLGVGVMLRSPPMEVSLAGRDQGSYALRGHQLARTARFDGHNPAVRRLIGGAQSRSHVTDLYPKASDPYRQGLYEAAYRPGWYLADVEAGRVVPQFLHLQPVLLGIGTLLSPAYGQRIVVWMEGLAALLAFAALSRSLWPSGPYALLAMAMYALSPLLIWTQRLPLTEGITGALYAGAGVAFLQARADSQAAKSVGDRVSRDGRPITRMYAVRAMGATTFGAALVGLTAWTRGDAWLAAPVVLATLWLRPRSHGQHVAAWVYAAAVAGSVTVHAYTVYPYLHDEFMKQLPLRLGAGPGLLLGLAGGGVAAWWIVDLWVGRLARLRPKILQRVLCRARWSVPLLVGGGVVAYLAQGRSDVAPFARLGALWPMLGPWLAATAVIGGVGVIRRWRLEARGDVWLLALLLGPACMFPLFAHRNIAHLHFFYYGRYLVPAVLPVAMLATVACTRELLGAAWLQQRARWTRGLAGGLMALVLLAASAAPLVTAPQLRVEEHVGAREVVDWIAARIQPGGVILAGGEGWHRAHTFNQIGGALEMIHGVAVLPYHSRERAHATAVALFVGHDAAEDGPVYLLVDEATRPYMRDDGRRVAMVDDDLAPGLRAVRYSFVEFVTEALRGSRDGLPRQVVRHSLRLVLIEIEAADSMSVPGSGVLGELPPAEVWRPSLERAPEPDSLLVAPAGWVERRGPLTWVSGRVLSRRNVGQRLVAIVEGRSIRLTPARPVGFVSRPVGPTGGEVDLLVMLRDVVNPSGAAIEVWARDTQIGVVEPPLRHVGYWRAPAFRWIVAEGSSQISLRWGPRATEDSVAFVRDVAAFSR